MTAPSKSLSIKVELDIKSFLSYYGVMTVAGCVPFSYLKLYHDQLAVPGGRRGEALQAGATAGAGALARGTVVNQVLGRGSGKVRKLVLYCPVLYCTLLYFTVLYCGSVPGSAGKEAL